MIKKVTVWRQHDKSDAFTMVLTSPTNVSDATGFVIDKIEGLGPVDADINTTEMVVDGDLFNSARIGKRNIVLDLIFYSETGTGVEEVRQKSYQLFPIKKEVYIEVESDHRKAWTKGYVEKNEPDIFSDESATQVSLICPDPKWYDSDTVVEVDIVPGTNTQVDYAGEVEIGGLVELVVGSAISAPIGGENPAFSISCANEDGDAQLIDIYTPVSGFEAGDVIKINSILGDKYCIYTDTADADHNALNLINQNPDWIKIKPGINTLRVNDPNSALSAATFTTKITYEGV